MGTHVDANFKRNYERHLQHLKLKGLQPGSRAGLVQQTVQIEAWLARYNLIRYIRQNQRT